MHTTESYKTFSKDEASGEAVASEAPGFCGGVAVAEHGVEEGISGCWNLDGLSVKLLQMRQGS